VREADQFREERPHGRADVFQCEPSSQWGLFGTVAVGSGCAHGSSVVGVAAATGGDLWGIGPGGRRDESCWQRLPPCARTRVSPQQERWLVVVTKRLITEVKYWLHHSCPLCVRPDYWRLLHVRPGLSISLLLTTTLFPNGQQLLVSIRYETSPSGCASSSALALPMPLLWTKFR
jgi:hypothetical protein